jgi:hypothetical protein
MSESHGLGELSDRELDGFKFEDLELMACKPAQPSHRARLANYLARRRRSRLGELARETDRLDAIVKAGQRLFGVAFALWLARVAGLWSVEGLSISGVFRRGIGSHCGLPVCSLLPFPEAPANHPGAGHAWARPGTSWPRRAIRGQSLLKSRYLYLGSLHAFAIEKALGSRSCPQIFFPARFGVFLKASFLSSR